MTARWNAPRSAASAWAPAARQTAASCVRATARRARSSTRRAAARACCGRCSAGALRSKGFQSEAVHEALDLCLSCKACKIGMPGAGGHGRVQVGVSGAALQGTGCIRCITTSSDSPTSWRGSGSLTPALDQRHSHRAIHEPADQAHCRRGAGTRIAETRTDKFRLRARLPVEGHSEREARFVTGPT